MNCEFEDESCAVGEQDEGLEARTACIGNLRALVCELLIRNQELRMALLGQKHVCKMHDELRR